MAIPISNQRISQLTPLPKLGKSLGRLLLDILIVGCLILILPPLALLVYLLTPILSFLVQQSAERERSARAVFEPGKSSDAEHAEGLEDSK